MSQKQVIALLRKYLIVLSEEGIPIDKAFLYGSYARNEASKESDIDVMLVSKIFDIKNDPISGKAWRLTMLVDARIEPYMVGEKKFHQDEYSPLLQIVKQEGIEIKV